MKVISNSTEVGTLALIETLNEVNDKLEIYFYILVGLECLCSS